MDKVKVTIHPRPESTDKSAVRSFDELAKEAGWDASDPGVGTAFLTPDGREVFNPVPFAAPIGFNQEPSVMEMIEATLNRRARAAQLDGDMEIDMRAEVEDFDMPEEVDFFSGYEIAVVDEAPAMPAPGPRPGLEDPPAAPVVDPPADPPVVPPKA